MNTITRNGHFILDLMDSKEEYSGIHIYYMGEKQEPEILNPLIQDVNFKEDYMVFLNTLIPYSSITKVKVFKKEN